MREGRVYLCREEYSRLVPADSIQMTSAYLHLNVAKLLKKYRLKHVPIEKKQKLAAVIHLCGVGRGEKFLRKHFHFFKKEKCGSIEPVKYFSRILKFQKMFKKIYKFEGHTLANSSVIRTQVAGSE